jgi:hypothetical protein
VDTHANHLAQQANDKEKKMSDTYGLTSFEPLASYDPDTHSWKMYAVISLWGLTESLQTLPKSGMTRNGKLFQQPVLARLIDATELSVWPMPRNCSAMAATITPESAWNPKRFPNLETVVGQRMWPTPTTQEVEHPNAELTATGRRKAKNGNTHSLNLADLVRLWPTPTARDGKGASGHKKESRRLEDLTYKARIIDGVTTGSLNPTWVEWLMGFPIGWTDLEA